MAELIQFDSVSGQRIASVVRIVEDMRPPARPLTYTPILSNQGRGKVNFRIASFTGPWVIGQDKVLTFKYVAATPNTANVTNLFWPITSDATRDCAIAREGTSWFLVTPQIDVGTALSSVTLGDSLVFTRISVASFGTQTTTEITTVTCTT